MTLISTLQKYSGRLYMCSKQYWQDLGLANVIGMCQLSLLMSVECTI